MSTEQLLERVLAVEHRRDVAAVHVLARAMAPAPAGGSALDVGCGLGSAALALAEDVGPLGTVLGVDVCQAAVDAASARAVGPVRFQVADVLDLPFPDGEFDLVRCEQVLQHVPDVERAFAELVRVTRPGGLLLLLDTDWTTLTADLLDSPVWPQLRRRQQRSVPNPHVGVTLRRRLVRAGCTDVHIGPYTTTMTTVAEAGAVVPVFDRAAGLLPDDLHEEWFGELDRVEAEGCLLVTLTGWLAAGRP